MKLVQEEAARLLCGCGHNIRCALRRQGEQLGFLVFLDDQETSKSYAQQVARCPGCGARLDHHLLLRAAR
jgi:hypothetical protein